MLFSRSPTEFLDFLSNNIPVVESGGGFAGSQSKAARADHVHPDDGGGSGGGAPTDAPYLTDGSDGTLSAERNVQALSSVLVLRPSADNITPLAVKRFSSTQSASLFQALNQVNVVLFEIDKDGSVVSARHTWSGSTMSIGTTSTDELQVLINNVAVWKFATDGSIQSVGSAKKLTNVADPTSAQDAATKAYVDAGNTTRIKTDGSIPFTGDQSLGGHKLTNVTDPTSAQDAATKAYVDTGNATRIKADGTIPFTGNQSLGSHKLTSVTDPTSAQDAATKAYVDSGNTTRIKADGTIPFTGDQTLGGNKITNAADPTSAQDYATKAYVDLSRSGDPKDSVRAGSLTNLNLASMPATVGGVTMNSGEAFVAMGQTSGAENGWYVFNGTGSAATRRSDADTSADVTTGAFGFISEGTLGGTTWAITTADPIVLNTTALTFTQINGPGTYTSTNGIQLIGTQFSPVYGTGSGTIAQGNDSRIVNAIQKSGSVAFTGDQSMGNNKLTTVATPTAGQDAANKTYVDTGNTTRIKADGSIAFTGDQALGGHKLTNVADPTSAQEAATKAYVDTGNTTRIKADGSIAFSGNQSMGNHKLTNVTDPTSAQDAATQAYVDSGNTTRIKADGSIPFTGNQSLGGFGLTNVNDPAAAQDAATKNYVDGLDVDNIKKDGSVAFTASQSMGGNLLTSVQDPADPQDAATKNYVDNGDAATLAAAGDIYSDGHVAFTADQSMGGHKLTSVEDPAADQDAATKIYVDTQIAARAAPAIILFGNSATADTNGTEYLDPGFGGRAAQGTELFFTMPYGGKLSKMYIRCTDGPLIADIVITIRVNGSDSPVTATLVHDTTTASDLTHDVDVNEGDDVSISAVSEIDLTQGARNLLVSFKCTLA